MNRKSELHRYLLKLVVLPLVILCATLTIVYFYLYAKQQEKLASDHHRMLTGLFLNSEQLLLTSPIEIENRANSVLLMDSHRSVTLLNSEYQLVAQYGLPSPFNLASIQNKSSVFQSNNSQQFNIFLDAPSTENKPNIATVIILKENYQNKLLKHQTISGLILAAALCFFILLYFVRQFDLALSLPIENMQTGLREFLRGNLGSRIQVNKNSIYTELVKLINNFASTQKEELKASKENINLATRELKESLESVEIQNIDLDFARKNAVQANQAKSEFLANTSHEIKTPLADIIGNAEQLLQSKLTKKQQLYLQEIYSGVNELNKTINDILDYSRLEMGTLTLEHKPVSVREIMQECIQSLSTCASEKNIQLLTIIDHDVPDNLLGDPQRIKQILINLISNAIKYTPEGYVLINISNDLLAEDYCSLRFKVTDSGIGLSESQQDTLLDQFTQPDSLQSRPRESTGLGLIIASGLIDRMNGKIGVESQKGQGATFWFTASFANNLAMKNPQANIEHSLSQVHAAAFHQNTMNTMEIMHYLRGWGANAQALKDPAQLGSIAIEASKTKKQQLFLLDVHSLSTNTEDKKVKNLVAILLQNTGILCVLAYEENSDYLFSPKDPNFDQLVQFKKPIIYQKLHKNISQHFNLNNNTEQGGQPSSHNEPEDKINVLAVDDNPANLKLLEELLRSKNADVDFANNGYAAIDKVKGKQYDLIFMDVNMPELDGIEATKHIRLLEENSSRTPIIALTAHSSNESKLSILAAGMDDYISKPMGARELNKTWERWVKSSSTKNNSPGDKVELDKSTLSAKGNNENESSEGSRARSPVDIDLSLQRAQNKADLAKDMLVMLINSLHKSREAIKKHRQAEEYKELHELIHQLHGGSCYCGVPDFTQICAALDSDLQRGDNSHLNNNLSLLFKQMDLILTWASNSNLDELFPSNAELQE